MRNYALIKIFWIFYLDNKTIIEFGFFIWKIITHSVCVINLSICLRLIIRAKPYAKYFMRCKNCSLRVKWGVQGMKISCIKRKRALNPLIFHPLFWVKTRKTKIEQSVETSSSRLKYKVCSNLSLLIRLIDSRKFSSNASCKICPFSHHILYTHGSWYGAIVIYPYTSTLKLLPSNGLDRRYTSHMSDCL